MANQLSTERMEEIERVRKEVEDFKKKGGKITICETGETTDQGKINYKFRRPRPKVKNELK